MIQVTKTYLPPIERYTGYLQKIWESNQLTNNGSLVQELESRLKEYLGSRHLFFSANGTLALQIAIKALNLHGEIITTPFSYVATTSSIYWENCQPVFVDIDPQTLCIDAGLIEAAITPRTSAILATHVYGIPCDVVAIEAIAQRHEIKVIYDAAHAFAATFLGKALAAYGDVSTLSFHATKLFHTVEGGALVTADDDLAHRIGYMRNFGHNGQEAFWGLGINAKNSELHAAMGLSILPDLPGILNARQQVSEWYDARLPGTGLTRPLLPGGTKYNYSYYPVLFESEQALLGAIDRLQSLDVHPRRYFSPVLSSLPYVDARPCPVAEDAARRVLCLPLYSQLEKQSVDLIMDTIMGSVNL